jgi:CPA1 family monovalent cation:H+ antiporter
MHHVDIIALGLMLLVACLVAILCRRDCPMPLALWWRGSASGFRDGAQGIDLTPELIFTVLLPRWCSRRRCICAGTSFAGKRRW